MASVEEGDKDSGVEGESSEGESERRERSCEMACGTDMNLGGSKILRPLWHVPNGKNVT